MNNDDHVLKYIFYINDNVQIVVEHLLHIDDNNANYNDQFVKLICLLEHKTFMTALNTMPNGRKCLPIMVQAGLVQKVQARFLDI